MANRGSSRLVLVGNQLSGELSTLEGLTDLPLFRDNWLCTRSAAQIVYCRAENSEV